MSSEKWDKRKINHFRSSDENLFPFGITPFSPSSILSSLPHRTALDGCFIFILRVRKTTLDLYILNK